MQNETFKVAVIGAGYWGPNLVRNFNSLRACTVKYVCDLDQERLHHMQDLYPGIQITPDYEMVVNDPEVSAIAVATPVHSHFKLVRAGLQRGKHTLVEKPMASSAAQCLELVRLAEEQDRVLMVGHTFLYSSVVLKIKQIVASGELGELLYITSQRLNLGLFQQDINVVWDLAPHDLAIILYVVGEDPAFLNCHGKARISPHIQEVSSMWLEFPSGTVATVHSSWLDPNKVRRMTFVGTKKMILYDDTQPHEKLRIYDRRVETPPHYDTFAEFHYSYHYGDTYSPHVPQPEPLKVQCSHFLDCIQNRAAPRSDGTNGLKVVKILEAASASMEDGGAKVKFNWNE